MNYDSKSETEPPSAQLGLVGLDDASSNLSLGKAGEEAWIDVIQKMDEVYADLVHHQLELEEKNTALEKAQEFIDSVQSSMTDVLIVCNRQGQVIDTNVSFKKLTGKQALQIKGSFLWEYFSKDAKTMLEALPENMRVSGDFSDHELSLCGVDGENHILSMNCTKRYDHNGQFDGLVLMGRPIGELRRAYQKLDIAHTKLRNTQAQLVFAEKMTALGRLVAGVAHELNNPISFVFANMHALKRYGERVTQYLHAIDDGMETAKLHALRQELKIDRTLADIHPLVEGTMEGAERVREIVRELRRFSSSQTEPNMPFNLVRVIKTASSWVLKATPKAPEIKFDMPDNLELVGRRGPVHQILVNLMQNAVDVLDGVKAPKLFVSCQLEGDMVFIKVEDNGTGIDETHMDKLFEPFFTTKRLGEGTGLGLYVSYGLAEEQGGSLKASNRKGGGACFTLSLPIKGPEDSHKALDEPSKENTHAAE